MDISLKNNSVIAGGYVTNGLTAATNAEEAEAPPAKHTKGRRGNDIRKTVDRMGQGKSDS